MRFKGKVKTVYKDGSTRIRTKFLWLPKKVDNERRWLEVATWKEVFVERDYSNYAKPKFDFWNPRYWIDETC